MITNQGPAEVTKPGFGWLHNLAALRSFASVFVAQFLIFLPMVWN